MKEVNETKHALQIAARAAWEKGTTAGPRKGTIAAGTGVGKSKIAVDIMMDRYAAAMANGQDVNILLVIPTEILRDTNWPNEFEEWYGEEGLKAVDYIASICYASLYKLRGEKVDLVVFDEDHHLTGSDRKFFQNNTIGDVLGLTATPPIRKRDPVKYELLHQYAPIVMKYSLDQGVDDEIIADFELTLVGVKLDNREKYIKGGNKKKGYFDTTEYAHYTWLKRATRSCIAFYQAHQAMIRKNMHFLYNLRSKERVVRKLVDTYCTDDKRTMVFCGSIAQAESLGAPNTWHSKNKRKVSKAKNPKPPVDDAMDKFMKKLINTIYVVSAANEGINVEDVDQAIIAQCSSNERELIQRLGRILRIRADQTARRAWVVYAMGTEDEKWLRQAIANIDSSKVKWIKEDEI